MTTVVAADQNRFHTEKSTDNSLRIFLCHSIRDFRYRLDVLRPKDVWTASLPGGLGPESCNCRILQGQQYVFFAQERPHKSWKVVRTATHPWKTYSNQKGDSVVDPDRHNNREGKSSRKRIDIELLRAALAKIPKKPKYNSQGWGALG